jgi:HSP20 family protein
MSDTIAAKENGLVRGKGYQPRAVAPPVDVFENADEILIVVDVPGVSLDAVEVRVENGTLTLEARRPASSNGATPALAREYEDADRVRTFRIPDGIDTERVSAEAKNGTILVRLPKVAAVKPRKIPVSAG